MLKDVKIMFTVAHRVYRHKNTQRIASFLFGCTGRAKKGIIVTRFVVVGPGDTWENEQVTVNDQLITAEYKKFCNFCEKYGIHVQ
jgi:hypothetical protein